MFTGDVEQVYLQMIADDYDGNYPLYEHYWCVKVPHHGMEEYYFDFSPYMPENMLISNGVYFANSKKESKPHRISAQYAGLFYIKDAHMYCSNENCCDGYQNGCTCKGVRYYCAEFLQGYINLKKLKNFILGIDF